jgi:hypothetical protein
VQPHAQIRIGGAQHARAGIRLHALDGGLGGQTRHHRLIEAVRPAAVVGEHAVGFEHVAVLAAVGELAAFEQHVEVGAQRLDRRFEAPELLRHVIGDEIGDDDARLVQHDVAERDAVVERRSAQVQRPSRSRLGRARARQRGDSPRGDHLGEHHSGGLQRLLFLLGIGAPRPVLHHQHASVLPGAQHRHAEKEL